ncbi:MAG: PAS domain-containing protein, partial [Bacteroidales bacterium]
MIIIDVESYKFIDVNEAAIKVFGYNSAEDILGKKIVDVSPSHQYDGELSSTKAASIIKASKNKETMTFEWLLQRPNGEYWDAEIHLLSFEFEKQIYLQYFIIDITERKKVEKALAESELRYRGIFENAQIGIYQTTPEGEILKANPALLKILGYDDLKSLSKRNLNDNVYFISNSREDFKETIHKHGFVKDYKSEWL